MARRSGEREKLRCYRGAFRVFPLCIIYIRPCTVVKIPLWKSKQWMHDVLTTKLRSRCRHQKNVLSFQFSLRTNETKTDDDTTAVKSICVSLGPLPITLSSFDKFGGSVSPDRFGGCSVTTV